MGVTTADGSFCFSRATAVGVVVWETKKSAHLSLRADLVQVTRMLQQLICLERPFRLA